ncbi:MAG: hypothetical protein ACON5B_11365 [Myxococcota bacterium]
MADTTCNRNRFRGAYGLLTCALVLPRVSEAAPVTLWLRDEAPTERERVRVERNTGETLHQWSRHLRFPASPSGDSDAEDWNHLADMMAVARQRWAEYDVEGILAADLHAAIRDLDVVRDDADLRLLREATALCGAAAYRAWDPEDFATPEVAIADGIRVEVNGVQTPMAWLWATGLEPSGRLSMAALIDGTAWSEFQTFSDVLAEQPPATLSLDGIPTGFDVVVDGQSVDSAATSVTLRPGRHWVHLEQDDVVHGRTVLDVAAGQELDFPSAVNAEELAAAAELLLATERTTSLPADFRETVQAFAENHADGVFLAAREGSRVVVVPFVGGARLNDAALVTGVASATLGGGFTQTRLFEQSYGEDEMVPSFSASFSMELGVSHALFAAGADLDIPPGWTIAYANSARTDNNSLAVFANPWAGLGFYVLRPVAPRPVLGMMGHVGYQAPSHMLYGGRMFVGIPFEQARTWVRLEAGASYGPSTMWSMDDDPIPLLKAFFRVGFSSGM